MNSFYYNLCDTIVGLALTTIFVIACLFLAQTPTPNGNSSSPASRSEQVREPRTFAGYTRDQILISITVWGEARGSTPEDQIEIARVIRNRVVDPRYPNTVEGVVRQPFQFSCWNANDPNRPLLPQIPQLDPNGFMEILNRVKDVMPDGRNLNYHSRRMNPYPIWAQYGTDPSTVGGHIFYTGAYK